MQRQTSLHQSINNSYSGPSNTSGSAIAEKAPCIRVTFQVRIWTVTLSLTRIQTPTQTHTSTQITREGKASPYSITERRVPELMPVLGSQPADDVSHKPGGRLPLLSARPAVTPAILNRAATNFAA